MNVVLKRFEQRLASITCLLRRTAMLLILACTLDGRAALAEVPKSVEEAALRATVQIVSRRGSRRRTGTGVLIGKVEDKLLVLTARHVLPEDGDESVEVTFYPHDRSAPRAESLQVVGQSSTSDLAVALVPKAGRDNNILMICDYGRKFPEHFAALTTGSRNGAVPTAMGAQVVGSNTVVHTDGETYCWLVEPNASPGCSGGPLIDSEGYIVGICHGTTESNRAAYIHLREIQALLKSAGISLADEELPADGPKADMPEKRSVVLAASVAMVADPGWTEPATYYAEVRLKMEISIGSNSPLPFPSPLGVEVSLPNEVELIEGVERFRIDKPGEFDEELTIGLKLPISKSITLTISPIGRPPWLDELPAAVVATISVKPPAAVATNISATVVKVGAPRWVDLVDGVAAVEAEIRLNVTGPLADGSAIAVAGPPGVRSLRLSPETVRRGIQVVRLEINAVVAPGRATSFSFQLQPFSRGAIDMQPEGPFGLTVIGPEPVRLVLSGDDGWRHVLQAHLPAGESRAVISTTPSLVGEVGEATLPQVECVLTAAGSIRLNRQEPLTLFRKSGVEVLAAEGGLGSYFRDMDIDGEISIHPSRRCEAIIGSTSRIHLHRTAPFKRILVIMLIAVFVGVVIYVPWRLLGRGLCESADDTLTTN